MSSHKSSRPAGDARAPAGVRRSRPLPALPPTIQARPSRSLTPRNDDEVLLGVRPASSATRLHRIVRWAPVVQPTRHRLDWRIGKCILDRRPCYLSAGTRRREVLKLYDTMSKQVSELEPLEQGQIKMYTCGPTVYRDAHIGNLRTYLMADWIRRTLEFQGVSVTQVKNITDVGHMRQEMLERGEDKVVAAALSRRQDPLRDSGQLHRALSLGRRQAEYHSRGPIPEGDGPHRRHDQDHRRPCGKGVGVRGGRERLLRDFEVPQLWPTLR